MRNKFHNHKTEINGIKFDSKKEANRYLQLLELQNNNLIYNLELQKKFVLQDKFIINNKTIREINYYADFYYIDNNNIEHIEDVKASKYFQDPVYKLKKKLFMYKYKKEISEIL